MLNICEKCKGKGYYVDEPFPEFKIKIKCEKCNGTGKIEKVSKIRFEPKPGVCGWCGKVCPSNLKYCNKVHRLLYWCTKYEENGDFSKLEKAVNDLAKEGVDYGKER